MKVFVVMATVLNELYRKNTRKSIQWPKKNLLTGNPNQINQMETDQN